MGFSQNSSYVRGDLFNSNGKWKYTVVLDYSFQTTEDYDNWDLWTQAKVALETATEKGISGVIMHKIPNSWMLVVLDPQAKYSHPISVIGGQDDS